jgi:hypothetical protein
MMMTWLTAPLRVVCCIRVAPAPSRYLFSLDRPHTPTLTSSRSFSISSVQDWVRAHLIFY